MAGAGAEIELGHQSRPRWKKLLRRWKCLVHGVTGHEVVRALAPSITTVRARCQRGCSGGLGANAGPWEEAYRPAEACSDATRRGNKTGTRVFSKNVAADWPTPTTAPSLASPPGLSNGSWVQRAARHALRVIRIRIRLASKCPRLMRANAGKGLGTINNIQSIRRRVHALVHQIPMNHHGTSYE